MLLCLSHNGVETIASLRSKIICTLKSCNDQDVYRSYSLKKRLVVMDIDAMRTYRNKYILAVQQQNAWGVVLVFLPHQIKFYAEALILPVFFLQNQFVFVHKVLLENIVYPKTEIALTDLPQLIRKPDW